MKIISRILKWLPLNLISILGIVQAVIKVIKELLTAIVNLIFPFVPDSGKFEKIVIATREAVNKIDEVIQKIKDFLSKRIGL